MLISTNIRNWGDGSDLDTLTECIREAESGGIHAVWVNDLLSSPAERGWSPTDGGRFLDPLVTLSFIAGATERIKFGPGVLIAPYRRPFLQYKQISTLQELSRGRLRLGVGVGWNEAEFRAIGVAYRERGKRTDEALTILREAFDKDSISIDGATLPTLPRPARPPIYVGGMTDVALRRVVAFGDGWLASGLAPADLAEPMAKLAELANGAGKPTPVTMVMKTLPLDDIPKAIETAQAYAEAGCVEISHGDGYPDVDSYRRRLEIIVERIIPSLSR